MFKLDTPIGSICDSLPPDDNQPPTLSSELCLSYILLILIYSTLLYKYISTYIKLFKLSLYSEMDSLDKTVIASAVIRLLNIYLLFLGIDLTVTIPLLILLWDFLILAIFLKFVFESMLTIKRICGVLFVLLVVYILWYQKTVPV